MTRNRDDRRWQEMEDPFGRAPGMQQGGMRGNMQEMQETPQTSLGESPVRSAEAEEAYQLGQRMGAEGISRQWGDDQGAGLNRAGTATAGLPMTTQKKMTRERLMEADQILMKYKAGKASVDRRIIQAQEWWKLNNWEEIEKEKGNGGEGTVGKKATAWLWNSIVGKHADAMDSYPEPIILPRMQDDEEEAKRLSEILPMVLQINHFKDTYRKAMWQKYQEGTGAYGVFWNPQKTNGMGDIDIRKINMLNLFWEPDISDIEESENVFYVSYVSNKKLEGMYPQLKGKLAPLTKTVSRYRTDDHVPLDDKSAVVDWYYHTWEGNRKILHYCKYVGDEVLYATEDQGDGKGLYDDGEYPFVLDTLFPVEGSPAGYGYIDTGKDTQTEVDEMSRAIVLNTITNSIPRAYIRKDAGVNEEEYMDFRKPLIHVNGNLGTDSIRPVDTVPLPGGAISMLQLKIDELKFVTGNTDVNNGGTPSGVTAASAIAALKEESGRSSKDASDASYSSVQKIYTKCIERIRQFYDIPRQFRILGEQNEWQFVNYSNAGIKPQLMPGGLGMEDAYRMPVFDIEVRAQRENAYTKMSQNELALQFYNAGMFNPQMSDQVALCLNMMDFKGKDEILQKVLQNGTMQDTLMKVAQIAMALAEKYQPEIAEELAAVVQGVAGDQMMPRMTGGTGNGAGTIASMPKADNAMSKANDANENAMVRRARERSQQASRPD